jgi:hypothetical protein
VAFLGEQRRGSERSQTQGHFYAQARHPPWRFGLSGCRSHS